MNTDPMIVPLTPEEAEQVLNAYSRLLVSRRWYNLILVGLLFGAALQAALVLLLADSITQPTAS